MEKARILVVDEDLKTRLIIRELALKNGYELDEAIDGITAIKLFRRHNYCLILLNFEIPELDGRNVFIQLRKNTEIPVFVLCDNPSDEHCLAAYKMGADDYIRKPFQSEELLARMKVFLRRCGAIKAEPEQHMNYQGLYIDTVAHVVYIDDHPILLTPKKYALLSFLSQNPNKAYTRAMLLDQVWGSDFFGSDRTIDTHIKSLRNSIKPYDHYLVTIWGYGYKFEIQLQHPTIICALYGLSC